MKRKTIRILLISSGLILILLVGYRLYLEYQTDIQLFLNPKASKTQLLERIRSHGFSAALLLVFLTAIMCAVPRDSNLSNWCDCRIEFWSLQRHTH